MAEQREKDQKHAERKQESLDNDVIAGDDDLVGRDASGTEPAWDGKRRDESAEGHERSATEEKKLTPGGDHPARTPGGTGPSTRDTGHAVEGDSNEQLIGRERLAGELKPKARPDDRG